jgi:hypothetical protein
MLGSNRYLRISIELLAGLFVEGNEVHLRVGPGIPAAAEIVDVYMDTDNNQVVLVYDRAISDPTLYDLTGRRDIHDHQFRETVPIRDLVPA